MNKLLLISTLAVISTSAFAQSKARTMGGQYKWIDSCYYDKPISVDSADYDLNNGFLLGLDSAGSYLTGYYKTTNFSAPTGSGVANKIAVWSSASVLGSSVLSLSNGGGFASFIAPPSTGIKFLTNDLVNNLTLDTGVTVFNQLQAQSKDVHVLSSADTLMSLDVSEDKVGILTSTPEYVLDVNGTIRTGRDGQDGQFRMYSDQGATDYSIVLRPSTAMTENTTYLLPPDNGDANEVLSTDGAGLLTWEADADGIYSGSGTLGANTVVTMNNRLISFTGTEVNAFSVDGTTFTIDAFNNNVGIGTAAPATPLHIVGDAGAFLTVSNALIGTPDIVAPDFTTFPSDASTTPIFIQISFNGQVGYLVFVPRT